MIWCLFRRQASFHPLLHMGPVKLNIAAYSGDVKNRTTAETQVATRMVNMTAMLTPCLVMKMLSGSENGPI
jgi:hypothetical protein